MIHHLTTLPNGVRVVTVPLHDTQAVTVFVLVKVGSRYEKRSINGTSHFIEHLMFKGTRKRPTTLDLSKLLDGVGANYNAGTAKDWTGYFVKINHAHTELALDVISDMLKHATFDPTELERERGVIIEEIKMYDENPVMAIGDLFETAVFGNHHPLGRTVQGTADVLKRVSRKEIIDYRDQFYHASNMSVIVAGKTDPKLMKYIAKYFGTVKRRPRTPTAPRYVPAKDPAITLKHQTVEQVQVALGVRAFHYTHPKLPVLNVLSVILGGNMSSRLFIEVREKRGLAYSVSSSADPFEDTGSFLVHVGLEHARLSEALKVIVAELRKLKTTKVGAVELNRAKEYLRGKTILNIEDSENLASWYGRQALFAKKIQSPEAVLKKLEAVTAADIQAVARQLFRPTAMRMAVIGPYKDTHSWLPILRSV